MTNATAAGNPAGAASSVVELQCVALPVAAGRRTDRDLQGCCAGHAGCHTVIAGGRREMTHVDDAPTGDGSSPDAGSAVATATLSAGQRAPAPLLWDGKVKGARMRERGACVLSSRLRLRNF